MDACTGPECDRPARADGLCATHYQQRRRGGPLKAIGRPSRAVVPSVRVSPECFAALEKRGPTIYEAARDVLERWARK